MAENRAVNYSSYLMLDKILSAQAPRTSDKAEGAEHDEMLFIIIHQVFELWFKQLLHEIDYAQVQLREHNVGQTLHVLKRMRNIVKVMVTQVDVIETMTPVGFNSFRDRLDSASGLQSSQFREVEFALGYKRPHILTMHDAGSEAYQKLTKRLNQPSLWDDFLVFIDKQGYDLQQAMTEQPVDGQIKSHPAILSALEKIYHSDPSLSALCESLIDLDEGMQEWRYRHVKMVQRTIGMKLGTGGSEGAKYLLETLNKPFFPDLWDVRVSL